MTNWYTYSFLLFIGSIIVWQALVEGRTDRRIRPGSGTIYHAWTHRLINFAYLGLIILSIVEYFVARRSVILAVSATGMVLTVIGIYGRNRSIEMLGDYWSDSINIHQNHTVVRDGFYAYVRHPTYLAALLNGLGICLAGNVYYTLAYYMVIFVPAYLIRMYLEDKVLVAELGDEYRKYMKERFALIPIRKSRG